MPGPIIQAPQMPWWADPAKASVTDPLYLTLIRKAMSAVGGNDPAGTVMGAAAPSPMLPGMGPEAGVGVSEGKQSISPLLQEIFKKNPAAQGVYEKAMTSQMPEVMEAKRTADAVKYARNADAHDALLDLHVAGRPRPIPTETGYATAIPLQSQEPVIPSSNRSGITKLSKSNLTEDMIKDIRSLGPVLAPQKYPNMNKNTIDSIARGDSWSWVK